MTRKINEIFYSLQGEGAHTGVPSVFIRFSGCNLKCGFCDTDHRHGDEMTDEAIVETVNQYPGEWIVLTGGEPTLWIDSRFVTYLKVMTGKKIAIETNGSRPVPPEVDWVTVSPKISVEGVEEHELKVERADELKVVEVGQDLEGYFHLPCVVATANLPFGIEATKMYLQPCFVADPEECRRNRERTMRRVLDDPRWTLSLQTHRFLGIQ